MEQVFEIKRSQLRRGMAKKADVCRVIIVNEMVYIELEGEPFCFAMEENLQEFK